MYDGTPCVVTSGPVHDHGYRTCSVWRFGVRIRYRHRLAWIDAHGMLPPPETPHILHHCDNPPCEEPTHLYAGTQADNVADMVRRNRARRGVLRGELNGSHLLTREQVASIRAEWAARHTKYGVLGARYGVTGGAIGLIIRGTTWPDPTWNAPTPSPARGEAVGGAKLTDAAVREMRAERARGATYAALGERFGVSRKTAERAVTGVAWAHVTDHL